MSDGGCDASAKASSDALTLLIHKIFRKIQDNIRVPTTYFIQIFFSGATDGPSLYSTSFGMISKLSFLVFLVQINLIKFVWSLV